MLEEEETYLHKLKPFALKVYDELKAVEQDKPGLDKTSPRILKTFLNPIANVIERVGLTPKESAEIIAQEHSGGFWGLGREWEKAKPKQMQFWEELYNLKGKELFKKIVEEDIKQSTRIMDKLHAGMEYTHDNYGKCSSRMVFDFQVNAPKYLDTTPETLKRYLKTADGNQAVHILQGLNMPKNRLKLWKDHFGVRTKKELFYKLLVKRDLELVNTFCESEQLPKIVEYTKDDLLYFLKNKSLSNFMNRISLKRIVKKQPEVAKKLVKGLSARKVLGMVTEEVSWAFRKYKEDKRDPTPLIKLFHPYIIRREQDAAIIYKALTGYESNFDDVVNKFLSVKRGKKQLKRTVNIISLVKSYYDLTDEIPNVDFTKSAALVEKDLKKAIKIIPNALGLSEDDMGEFQKRDDIDLWMQTIPPLMRKYYLYQEEKGLVKELIQSVHNDDYKEWKFGEEMPANWVKTNKRTFTESDSLKNSPEVLLQYVNNSEKEFEEGSGPSAEFQALRTMIRQGNAEGTYEFLTRFLPNVRKANESAAEHLENILNRLKEDFRHKKHTGLSRKVVVTDKFDPLIYLRIGNEPVRTCMHFASGGFNQGLISLSSDATKKIIGVYDNGRILSRCILHYADAKIKGKEKKVLLVDNIYFTHGQHKQFILDFVREKARKMKLPLVYENLKGGELEFMVSGRAKKTYLNLIGPNKNGALRAVGLKKQGEWRVGSHLIVEKPRRGRKR